MHQGAIGDFLLTLSVVGAVRGTLGSARVEVIASAASARWAAAKGIVDRWHGPDRIGLHTLFAHDGPLDARLSQLLREATLVLSLLGAADEAVHDRLRTATKARVISVDPRPKPSMLETGTHITEQWAAEIRKQGLAIGNPIAPRTTRSGKEVVRMNRPTDSTRRVIIHPGSGGRHKCWPMDKFLVLADALAGEGVHVAWMLGPAECEASNKQGEAVRRRVGEEVLVEDDLSTAAELISSYALYIGNDGGMTHLAAATGVGTLAIFTATDPRIWRPLGENVSVTDARSQSNAMKDLMDTLKPLLVGLKR